MRSWDVRKWMKAHGFRGDAYPGMHIRDEVVERLRQYGLNLTPKPLTMTALNIIRCAMTAMLTGAGRWAGGATARSKRRDGRA